MGAIRYLEKPVDTDELLLTIAEILTQGPPTMPVPLEEREFYKGYQDRLKDKLRHKNNQMARIERLLVDLPPQQKPTFNDLLNETRSHRNQIQEELDRVSQILDLGNSEA